jgi:hypothetical protein
MFVADATSDLHTTGGLANAQSGDAHYEQPRTRTREIFAWLWFRRAICEMPRSLVPVHRSKGAWDVPPSGQGAKAWAQSETVHLNHTSTTTLIEWHIMLGDRVHLQLHSGSHSIGARKLALRRFAR